MRTIFFSIYNGRVPVTNVCSFFVVFFKLKIRENWKSRAAQDMKGYLPLMKRMMTRKNDAMAPLQSEKLEQKTSESDKQETNDKHGAH